MRSKSQQLAIIAIGLCLVFIIYHFSKNQQASQTRVLQPMVFPEPLRSYGTPTEEYCVPQDSVYFLKIPKCASTTCFQIFVAYGVKHGLTFAVPYGPIASPERLPVDQRPPDVRYNMVVTHTRFNEEKARKVMKESAKYVACIREPASRFESMWYFGNYEKRFHMNFDTFLKTRQYSSKQESRLNMIAIFFGINTTDPSIEREINNKAKRLNEVFDLVMISERFDESLVLLRHLMCWNIEDVAYVKAKIRSPTYRPKFSKADKDTLRKLNNLDVILYKFFVRIFEEKVKAFGKERMQEEIEALHRANERLIADCGATLTGTLKTVVTWEVKSSANVCKMISLNGSGIRQQLLSRQKKWASSNLTYDLLTWTFA
ncbi:galactosylceramide sulfotransferase-like isoform X2 [Penaeus japonicus]|uniref:galactosylceramide sulfotransferase-like isoform X2 n=1 Tax=Penaeus japonicus TaxID=27405 RepID=UPI001C717402|nr:galactosylceramide sulfotransferase-like isoform X2 [Penaeus japonicus]